MCMHAYVCVSVRQALHYPHIYSSWSLSPDLQLETYSKNLEDVLEERTQWLKLEKKRNNMALHRA